MDDLLKWLPPVLVVAGWVIVNHQNDKRETRKEARSLVDAAKKLVGDIASKALDYHVNGNTDLAFEIKAGLDQLEIECERLPSFVRGCPLMAALIALQDAATGGDFESAVPLKKSRTSPEVLAILRARTELLAELERVFRVRYLGLGGNSRPWG